MNLEALLLEEILPHVEKPSRYLGNELNVVRKERRADDLRFALAFPDLYDVGLSNLGILILYDILNRMDGVVAERAYMPAPDLEAMLRARGLPSFTWETKTPLSEFDAIGFSIQYELSVTNILTMLDLAGIPIRAEDRDDRHPITFAGGPCVYHPEPYARALDAIVIGDGEEAIVAIANTLRGTRGMHRRERLEELAAHSRRVRAAALSHGDRPRRRDSSRARRSHHQEGDDQEPGHGQLPDQLHRPVHAAGARPRVHGSAARLHAGMPLLPGGDDLSPGAGTLAGYDREAPRRDDLQDRLRRDLAVESFHVRLLQGEASRRALGEPAHPARRRGHAAVAAHGLVLGRSLGHGRDREEVRDHVRARSGDAAAARADQQMDSRRRAVADHGLRVRARLDEGEALLHDRPSHGNGRGRRSDRASWPWRCCGAGASCSPRPA